MKILFYFASLFFYSTDMFANDSLYFKLDSFKSPSYELKIANGKGIVLYYRGGIGLRDPRSSWCIGDFGKVELDLVMLALKEEGIFDWEEKYSNLNILDGTMFHIYIHVDGKIFNSIGLNEYPKNFDKLEQIIFAIKESMNCKIVK